MSGGGLFGVALALFILLVTIVLHTDNYLAFFNFGGFLLVIGGVIAYAFLSYPSVQVKVALRAIGNIIRKPEAHEEDLNFEIKRMITWAYLIQRKGLKEFEKNTQVTRPLLRYGIDLIISGYKSPDVRAMLHNAIEGRHDRATAAVPILRNMGSSAPAFGMIGTLVGMIIMLGNIDSDMTKIGGGMAIAMLATLYGVVSARLIFLPAAENLQSKQEFLRFRDYLITEGLCMIADKQNPRFMQDKLNSYIPSQYHFNIDTQLKLPKS